MEVQTKNIFYIEIWENKDFYSGKLAQPLFYPEGKLQVYFCILPDEDNLPKNRWKRKRRERFLLRCLSEAYQEACKALPESGFEGFDAVLMSKSFVRFFIFAFKRRSFLKSSFNNTLISYLAGNRQLNNCIDV